MLEINLLPVREARRKADLRELLMQLVFVLILTAGAVAIVHSRTADQIETGQVRLRQMENDIAQFKPQLEQVAAFRQRKAKLEKKIDVIDGLDRARSGPVRVMSELASSTPERLWLTSLQTKGNSVTMKGESLDNEIVALFLRALADSAYFDEVDLDSTELGGQKKEGFKLVTFRVRAVLVDPDSSKAAAEAAAG